VLVSADWQQRALPTVWDIFFCDVLVSLLVELFWPGVTPITEKKIYPTQLAMCTAANQHFMDFRGFLFKVTSGTHATKFK
jgi:hypothetical protein